MSESTTSKANERLFFKDTLNKTVDVKINGINHVLLFDTGAGATLINKPKFEIVEDKKVKERKVYGFAKKVSTTSTLYSSDSLNFGFIKSNNKVVYLLRTENKISCTSNGYDGVLGNFFNDIDLGYEIELNYSEGFVKLHEDVVDKKEYYVFDMKSSSNSGKISIKLEIDGISDYFLFDTGNYTAIILNNDIYKITQNKVTEFSLISKSIGDDVFINNFTIHDTKLKLANDVYIDQYVAQDITSKRSTLNFNFIKKFNWIIDRKNNKIYCKPISDKNLNSKYVLPKKSKLVGMVYEKLIVNFSIMNQSNFKCGDEITSVKGEKINTDNICEMIKLLNSEDDWSKLNVQIAE